MSSQADRREAAKQAAWDRRFLGLCDHMAGWSEDRDFQVGAVITGPGHEIRASGYNGLARGVRATPDQRLDRPSGEKFFWVEHAERNAIYNAARMGVPLAECTLYVNRFPCADCARAIIQSGIVRVCSPPKPSYDGALDRSFDVSETMLREAGVNWDALTAE
ncbi:dCMP deaminase [Leisingera caerulea]|uniref:dCMP deaminase n=1 Tax=Leisingera caerulea TaxID=506591 RepID=A0ABY5WTG3_LEICA|nr:deaminase [Leisingera caerulea]UWQ57607.1 dCMP deaminase [Leisingera caerulea]